MIRFSGSVFLLASLAFAQSNQKLMPGTVASTAVPDTESSSSSSSSPVFSAAHSSSSDARQPMSASERVRWVLQSTLGPESLAAGLFSAGWGTGFDSPKEYGPHWEGFGDRYGMRLSGLAASNTMEAGLGAIWGEDPRYVRDQGAPFGHRLGHAAKMTFMAEDRNGNVMPAYARFIAIPGSNFLSNTWRPESDSTVDRALIRTGLGFLGRFGGNTFDEFWPDVRQKLFHRSADQVSR
jgi:hypothetical protein